jgi:ribose transport system substrate-binding protein
MRLRKAFLFLLIIVLVVTGTVWAGGQQDSGTKPEDAKFLVGFANSSVEHPWRIAIQNAILREAEKYDDIAIITTEAGEDPVRQVNNVEDMLARGIDLLLVCTVAGEPFKPAVEMMKKAGLPLVPVDRAIVGDDYACYIEQSNLDIGRKAADWIAEQMIKKYGEPRGKIVELQGVPGNIPAEHRRIGFHEQVAAKWPMLEIVAAQPTDYTRADALTVMENIIQGQKLIDAVYTHEDEIAFGAIDALKEARRLEGVIITGNGGSDRALQSIKKGEMTACFTYSPIDFGLVGMQMAAKILKGETVPKIVKLEGDIITLENVDTYIQQLESNGEVYVSTR